MNKTLCTLIVLLFLSPFLVQCASQDEVRTLSYQLRAVNKKLEDMQAKTVTEMRKKQATSSGQLTEMQQELLALKSELEATAVANRQLQEQNKELGNSLQEVVSKQSSETDIKITQLNEQLKQQQDNMAALQAARVHEAERKASAAAEAAEAARLKVKMTGSNQSQRDYPSGSDIAHLKAERKKQIKSSKPVSAKPEVAAAPPARLPAPQSVTEPVSDDEAAAAVPATPPSAKSPKKEPQQTAAAPADDLFNQAEENYKAGNYQNAFELFESYIDKNGSGAKAIQARYMMGECLYQQKEYDQAILQYQKIIASHPKDAKTPAALLKQGMAFEQLSDKETAKIIYQKIISSYGSSPEAGQAKSKLSSL